MASYQSSASAERSFDWITFSIYLSLVTIGWLMIYSTEQATVGDLMDFSTTIGKQTIWVGISIVAFVVAVTLNWRSWDTLAYPIYIFGILLLVGVLIFGSTIKGSTAWYVIGGVSFQPSELAKLTTCVALASFLSNYSSDLRSRNTILTVVGIIALPMVLVMLQPDIGSVLVFLSFGIVLLRQGLNPVFFVAGLLLFLAFIFSIMYDPWVVLLSLLSFTLVFFLGRKLDRLKTFIAIILVIGIAIVSIYYGLTREASIAYGVLVLSAAYWIRGPSNRQLIMAAMPALIFLNIFSFGARLGFEHLLKPHQQERINVWLRPHLSDPKKGLYNIIQSKLAISSGGFQGKGFMQGNMTKLNYVPEQNTDFIFSTVGEEQGFVGCISVIVLFVLLLFRITSIAEKTKHKFITNYAYGLAGILFLHFFVNIGMTMGIMPVVGIPLPFLSKGGSSLLVFSIMIGILLRMDLARYKRV